MNKITKNYAQRLLKVIVIYLLFQPALSFATPAYEDNVRIHTGTSRRNGDALFSVTGEWRKDEALSYLSKGMVFIKGVDHKKTPDSIKIAKKLVTAIKDGMVYLYPGWRGAVPVQTPNQPIVTISNAEGFSFMFMTIKDYANQILTYDLVDKSFAAANVDVSLDIVQAADIESLMGSKLLKKDGKTIKHSGEIKISVDDKSISITTDGKSTSQIEKEIASGFSNGKLSSSPLYSNLKDGDDRNTVPFDGSEVQFIHLAADSITTDILDPTLGVLIKLKFKDENKSHDFIDPPTIVLFGGILVLLYLGFQFYKTKRENQLEEGE